MKQSAGILLYRKTGSEPEFFLVHPGGPFFAKKQEGWWTIPKGEPNPDEDLLECAIREFEEETGYRPSPPFTELAPITQKGGKKVYCWAAEGDLDPDAITCNTFEIEWPPKSGRSKLGSRPSGSCQIQIVPARSIAGKVFSFAALGTKSE